MSDMPRCPKCGSTMVKRQARRGPNAGSYFYGCSQFPRCRGTVDITNETYQVSPLIDDEATEIKAAQNKNRPYLNVATLNFPVELRARPRSDGFETIFIDGIALPSDVFAMFNGNESFKRSVASFAKWRMDFAQDACHELTDKETAIISVIEKIVNRGRLTRLSEKLERAIFRETKDAVGGSYNEETILSTLEHYNSPNIPNELLDGSERDELNGLSAEEYFYSEIFINIAGEWNVKDVLPQAHLDSLVIEKEDVDRIVLSQRVDFLITHGDRAIVVEIDDPTHYGHFQKDDERDKLLEKNGLKVFRVDAEDLACKGPTTMALVKELEAMYGDVDVYEGSYVDVYDSLIATKLAHQFQVVLIELIKCGKLKYGQNVKVGFNYHNIPCLESRIQRATLRAALDDLRELSRNICKLYRSEEGAFDGIEIADKDPDYFITINDNYDYDPRKIIYIQDISFPLPIIQNTFYQIKRQRLAFDEDALGFLLKYIYRFDGFRPNQIDGIRQTIEGYDTIVLLPTGSGKSVVYQLLSFVMPGMVLVFDPIISLIEDQIDNLSRIGVDRALGITANTEYKPQLMLAMAMGHYSMAFVSPERLQMEGFRSALARLSSRSVIPVCAIDEAHCVSEWGHDFRLSYLNLANTCRHLLKSEGAPPCILALTGTASEAVLKDMERDLQIDDSYVIRPDSFDRKEIEFIVVPSLSTDKQSALTQILSKDLPRKFGVGLYNFFQANGDDTMSGIVFCPHVNGKYGVESIRSCCNNLGIDTEIYAGSKPKYMPGSEDDWSKHKASTAKRFKDNDFSLLAATKSYGMGIDKPNIRYTIHYGLPQSIEAYYQEAGRAGRDRKKSYSYVIVSNDYPESNKKVLSPSSSIGDMQESMDSHKQFGDDVDRMLFFHTRAFEGVEDEIESATKVLDKIGKIGSARLVTVAEFKDDREKFERVIYRLAVLGIVEDYTVDFAAKEFNITLNEFSKKAVVKCYGEYVRRYQDDEEFVRSQQALIECIDDYDSNKFTLEALRVLLKEFVYNIIERSRRNAFAQLLEVTTNAAKIEDESKRSQLMRQEILRYLGNTQVNTVKRISDNPRNLRQIKTLVDKLKPDKRKDLYAEVGRTLQAYPQHPALLLSQIYIRILNGTDGASNIVDAIITVIDFGRKNYNIDDEQMVSAISSIVNKLGELNKKEYVDLINILSQTDQIDDELRARLLGNVLPVAQPIARMNYVNKMTEKLRCLGKDGVWRTM